MASGFTPAAKRSRTANEGTSVRKQGKELGIPWEDICPAQISDWLDMFSKAHNTTREILLASILPTVACLMGQSTIKVGCRVKAESINLFLIFLCDPGSGKSPAFQHGCAQPVRLHVEAKEDIPFVRGRVHRSRAVPPTQGNTWPQGHHWKRRGFPVL